MKLLKIKTEKMFTSLEQECRDYVRDSLLNNVNKNGMLNIYCQHTTAGILIYEPELLLLADTKDAIERFAPSNGEYRHDYVDLREVPLNERVNGHSHIKSLLTMPSVNIPIINGELALGKWQVPFLVELDPIRERNVILSICNTL